MISQPILDKFKDLYFKDYLIQLSDTEALEKCTVLFTALSVITKPLTDDPRGDHNEN